MLTAAITSQPPFSQSASGTSSRSLRSTSELSSMKLPAVQIKQKTMITSSKQWWHACRTRKQHRHWNRRAAFTGRFAGAADGAICRAGESTRVHANGSVTRLRQQRCTQAQLWWECGRPHLTRERMLHVTHKLPPATSRGRDIVSFRGRALRVRAATRELAAPELDLVKSAARYSPRFRYFFDVLAAANGHKLPLCQGTWQRVADHGVGPGVVRWACCVLCTHLS